MKSRRKTSIALALLGTVLISAGAMADHHGGKNDRQLDRMAHHLEMDDAQKALVKAVFDEYQPQIKALRQESREVRKALREAAESGGDIEDLAATQGDLMAQMIVLRNTMKSRVDELLTEEQRAKISERKQRRKHRRGRGKGGDV